MAEISAIAYFAPIAAFLLVFIVSFAILAKTKLLGESNFVQLFISLLISALFVSAIGVREYVQTIVPWFAVLLISLFLVLALVGFVGKPAEFMQKGIGIVFVVLLGFVFLVSAFVVFSDVLVNYIPGPFYGAGGDVRALLFTDWLYSPRVLGALSLIIISAVVSWILVKSK